MDLSVFSQEAREGKIDLRAGCSDTQVVTACGGCGRRPLGGLGFPSLQSQPIYPACAFTFPSRDWSCWQLGAPECLRSSSTLSLGRQVGALPSFPPQDSFTGDCSWMWKLQGWISLAIHCRSH